MYAKTQAILNITNIKDNILITKSGTFCLIMQTNAINFDLLSENEQDAMIGAYAQLVSSLTFPIQICITTRRMDITQYLQYLENFEKRQPNKVLRDQISFYRNFINQLVVTGNVLYKKFFIVLSYDEAESEKATGFAQIFSGLLRKDPQIQVSQEQLERAKTNLLEKKEFIMGLLNRMGIRAEQLKTKQIVDLFYNLYNPDEAEQQHLSQDIESYTSSIVKPAME